MCVERVLAQKLRHVGGVMSLLSEYRKGGVCRCDMSHFAKLNDLDFGWFGWLVSLDVWLVGLVWLAGWLCLFLWLIWLIGLVWLIWLIWLVNW